MAARLNTRILIILTLLLAACGGSVAAPTAKPAATHAPTPSAGTIQHLSLTVDGQVRYYRLFVPATLVAKQPSALVVLLHGCQGMQGSGDQAASISQFDGEATLSRLVAVYPDGQIGQPSALFGRTRCWNAGHCCIDNLDLPAADDVAFISQLLDRLISDLPIDRARIFVAGGSGGAYMAYRLACELSGRIAGIASVSGAMAVDTCNPARPVSILEMHGTNDANVSYDDGSSAVQRWTAIDGCVGDPTIKQSGITKTSMWRQCKGGAIVRFDTVVGGRHTWFGSAFAPVPGEPDASTEIWKFFSSLQPAA